MGLPKPADILQQGSTALLEAIDRNRIIDMSASIELIKLLLQHGADIDTRDKVSNT